jgi:soluble lytic murein transglycosylase-like protein
MTDKIKKEYLISISLIILLYSANYLKCDTIVFHHGDKLTIYDYALKDNYITLKLSGGNEISIPIAWVKEIRIEASKTKEDLSETNTNPIFNNKYLELIKLHSKKESIDWKLIFAIIKYESNFNKEAVSPKGAMGLMQLMPQTAKIYNVKNPFDPEENIKTGIKHFKELLNLYNNDIKLALAAYNAGKEAVNQYSGIPPFKETQNYINSIISFYQKLQ